MRLVVTAFAVICLAYTGSVAAKPRGGGSASPRTTQSSAVHKAPASHASKSVAKPASSHPKSSTKAQGVQRNTKGHIARDPAQKAKFERSHPCPSTGKSSGACPGYVVDHVKPLKRGGADRPENMQLQTKAAAKQKDKTE